MSLRSADDDAPWEGESDETDVLRVRAPRMALARHVRGELHAVLVLALLDAAGRQEVTGAACSRSAAGRITMELT